MTPSGDATVLKLHRAVRRVIVLAIALFAPFAVGATLGALDPDRWLTTGSGTTERVISGVIALFFDPILLFLLVALFSIRRTQLAFDASGVWQFQAGAWTLTHWDEIERIGLIWSVRPTVSIVRIKDYAVEIVPGDGGEPRRVDLPALTRHPRRIERAVARLRPQSWSGRRQVAYEGVRAKAARRAAAAKSAG